MQAQDYHGAKWALALRMKNATDESIEGTFNKGTILRTHVMRPTWHFVAPSDIRWMAELTAPRVNASNAYMYRRLKLDSSIFLRSNNIIARALEGRRYLTRTEIAEALTDAGIRVKGLHLIYLIMRAEMDALICSGPRRGKQFTYALLDERAPQSKNLDRKQALGELVKRYFTGHGPATLRDFVWWSGLTMVDAKAGLECNPNLTREEIDGRTYWFLGSMNHDTVVSDKAFLLPTFDEFFVGYASFDKSRMGAMQNRKLVLFNSPIITGGKVVGSWRREIKKGATVIEASLFDEIVDEDLVISAAHRYGEFMRLPVACSIKRIV